MGDQPAYLAAPTDALHGAVLVVAQTVDTHIRQTCDQFAEDGYQAAACTPGDDLSALLRALPKPRFLFGVGPGADAMLAIAGEASAASAVYPDHAPSSAPAAPTIFHFGKDDRLKDPDVQALVAAAPSVPVFAYACRNGFFEPGSAYDPDCARLVRLRTLALFRRTVSRGES
jgi:dienelactone hydrolase